MNSKHSFRDFEFKELEDISRTFFKTYGSIKMLGHSFFKNLAKNKSTDLFDRLLLQCGYDNKPEQFFKTLIQEIFHKNSNDTSKVISINGFRIPNLYLYHLLEIMIPGNRFYSIKNIEALEERAFIRIEDENKQALQEILDNYPVRLSDHVIRQSLVSKGVANQYIPFAEELDSSGGKITFDGHAKKGVLEQMYQNRVIFLLEKNCPVYCRFCFRKHKSSRKENNPTRNQITDAIGYVEQNPDIKEVLITGGEPLLNKPNIETALHGLIPINHIQVIRIATRSVAYFPDLFLRDDAGYIKYLIEKNNQCLEHDKRIEIGIHFVHPDEISIQSLTIISQFVKNGIQVYVQTPFLKDINTDPAVLSTLFNQLRNAGAQIYYIFTPCSPIHGTKPYWTSIFKSLKTAAALNQNVSDRCIPKICTATPLGKIEWFSSGWAVETDTEDSRFSWIRTPYTLDYFQKFTSSSDELPEYRINENGTLDAKFQVTLDNRSNGRSSDGFNEEHNGTLNNRSDLDNNLIFGKNYHCKKELSDSGIQQSDPAKAKDVLKYLLADQTLKPSVFDTPSSKISRYHKACVEITIDAGNECINYIGQHPDISDVMINMRHIDSSSLKRLDRQILRLKAISHISSIRLKIRKINSHPEILEDNIIEHIFNWSDFSIDNPFRIEFEIWFLHPDEVTQIHRMAAQKLIGKGMNMYANVILISGVNDHPKTITKLAHTLRAASIEFNSIYTSGLEIQNRFNQKNPTIPNVIIEIASEIRKQCSGRQIPRYIECTPNGEQDFGYDSYC